MRDDGVQILRREHGRRVAPRTTLDPRERLGRGGACVGCGTALGGQQRKWCSDRCRKAQYSVSCPSCGKPMSGGNGRTGAPARCASCPPTFKERAGRAGSGRHVMDGKIPTERMLDGLRRFAAEHPGLRYQEYDVWSRTDPLAVCGAMVRRRCGSWWAALAAAGVCARP